MFREAGQGDRIHPFKNRLSKRLRNSFFHPACWSFPFIEPGKSSNLARLGASRVRLTRPASAGVLFDDRSNRRTAIDDPNGVTALPGMTVVNGINDAGQSSGFQRDAAGIPGGTLVQAG